MMNALTSGWVEFLAPVVGGDTFPALMRYYREEVSWAYFTAVALRIIHYKLWQKLNVPDLHPSIDFLEGDFPLGFKTNPNHLMVTWQIKGRVFV